MHAMAIIPALNEQGSVGRVVERLRAANAALPIVVIDDGSTDATGAVARAAGAAVVRLPSNLGCGVALQTGYKYALREGYDAIVQLDADGQHEPADAAALLAVIARGEADVAVGSRFIGDSEFRGTRLRRLGMRLFGFLAFAIAGSRFSDVTSGFRALNRDVLRFFAEERYPCDYPDADVLVMLTRAGFRVKEVPVHMYARAGGASQHAGLRPVYYVFKMFLSLALVFVRREAFARKEA